MQEAIANGVPAADQQQVFQLFRTPGMPDAASAALLQRVRLSRKKAQLSQHSASGAACDGAAPTPEAALGI